MYVGVEGQMTIQVEQSHVRVLSSGIVILVHSYSRHVERLSCRVSHLHRVYINNEIKWALINHAQVVDSCGRWYCCICQGVKGLTLTRNG